MVLTDGLEEKNAQARRSQLRCTLCFLVDSPFRWRTIQAHATTAATAASSQPASCTTRLSCEHLLTAAKSRACLFCFPPLACLLPRSRCRRPDFYALARPPRSKRLSRWGRQRKQWGSRKVGGFLRGLGGEGRRLRAGAIVSGQVSRYCTFLRAQHWMCLPFAAAANCCRNLVFACGQAAVVVQLPCWQMVRSRRSSTCL